MNVLNGWLDCVWRRRCMCRQRSRTESGTMHDSLLVSTPRGCVCAPRYPSLTDVGLVGWFGWFGCRCGCQERTRPKPRRRAASDLDPRSPPDANAFAHALLRRRKPVPSPAGARARSRSTAVPSSRTRTRSGLDHRITSPSDAVMSPASKAVARLHGDGKPAALPVYVLPRALVVVSRDSLLRVWVGVGCCSAALFFFSFLFFLFFSLSHPSLLLLLHPIVVVVVVVLVLVLVVLVVVVCVCRASVMSRNPQPPVVWCRRGPFWWRSAWP